MLIVHILRALTILGWYYMSWYHTLRQSKREAIFDSHVVASDFSTIG
jgi:hypothetical protein